MQDGRRQRPIFQLGHTFFTKVAIAVSRLALLFILGQVFGPAEFGAYSLITITITLALVVVGLNANVYIYRAVPGQSDADARRILGTVAALELGLATAVLILIVATSSLARMLDILNVESYSNAFLIALIWLLLELHTVELKNFFYGRQQVERANAIDLIKQVGWVPVVALLAFAHVAVTVEVVVVVALAASLVAVVYGDSLARPWAAAITLPILKEALRFGAPLILPTLGILALRFVDRYFLSAYRSLDEVGLYSLIASLMNAVYASSALVADSTLTPRATRASNLGRGSQRDRILWTSLGLSVTSFMAAAVIAWGLAAFGIGRVIRADYAPGLGVLPLVAFGYVVQIIGTGPHNVLWLAGRTRALMVVDSLSVLAALGLDYLLIPGMGMYGAAYGTIVGLGISTAVTFVMSGFWRSFRWSDAFFGFTHLSELEHS